MPLPPQVSLPLRSLIAVWLVGPIVALAADGRPVPLSSTIEGVQPMTGIVLWTDNDAAAEHPDAISLEYRYCGYDEVVGPGGEYDWGAIDNVLDEVAGRGHQAVLRFYWCYVGKRTTVPRFVRDRDDYRETVGRSEGEKTHFCDWSNTALQEFALQFYSRFADRYDDDPRLAFLQTGFGLWGEYHIYEGPLTGRRSLGKTFPDKDYQARFLRHLDEEFASLPWSISIDAADSTYSPLEDNDDLLGLGFGLFDDSFLCKPHPKENAVNWAILRPERWQRHPAGGEFSYYNRRDQRKALSPSGPNGVSFEQAARQFHISYMIGNDQPEYVSVDRIREAAAWTGYRFRVTAARETAAGLELTVTNEGVAPIYRDAFFAAGGQRAAESLRGLLPGKELRCTIPGAGRRDGPSVAIESDAILPGQRIGFAASLK